jgi:hypothetical protein
VRREHVFADRVDHVAPLEHPLDLVGREAVRDVGVVQDLVERAPASMLADDVLGHELLLPRLRDEE